MPGQPLAGPNPYTAGYQTGQYGQHLPPRPNGFPVTPVVSSTSVATAAGTTTLTIASTPIQVFTGTTTQTVKLPTTGVVIAQQLLVINQSTGVVTVQSSGANTIFAIPAGTSAAFSAVIAVPTTAANWGYVAYNSITPPTTIGMVGTTTKTVFDNLEYPPAGGVAAENFSVLQENLNPPVGAGGNIGTNTSLAEAVGEV